MIVFIIALFSASMVIAGEQDNVKNSMHEQIAKVLSTIISNDYKKFVIEEGKELQIGQRFASIEDAQQKIIWANGGVLPISHQAKIKIVEELSYRFDNVTDACDFFNEYADNNAIHETSKEKTLQLLTTHYENIYVRENFFGKFCLKRLLDVSNKVSGDNKRSRK